MARRRARAPVIPALSAGTWAAAGNRFTKLRVVPPLPISAYRSKIAGVPLTGGQNSGTIGGLIGTSGTVTSPGAFVGIAGPATFTAPGTYTVQWTVSLSGTVGPGDANGFIVLLNNSTVVATSVNAGAPGTYPQAPFTGTFSAGDFLVVFSGAAPTAGAVYSAVITTQPLPLSLTVGPQGLGTAWYPAQVTLSTSTGALDSSTALVYLGVGGVPTSLVGQVFSGNGVLALAVPPMQAGDLLFVTWTSGHIGDIASMNVIGTMDALTTGRG
jgi:hypothetical protein